MCMLCFILPVTVVEPVGDDEEQSGSGGEEMCSSVLMCSLQIFAHKGKLS